MKLWNNWKIITKLSIFIIEDPEVLIVKEFVEAHGILYIGFYLFEFWILILKIIKMENFRNINVYFNKANN
jgi:hypothetical protein